MSGQPCRHDRMRRGPDREVDSPVLGSGPEPRQLTGRAALVLSSHAAILSHGIAGNGLKATEFLGHARIMSQAVV